MGILKRIVVSMGLLLGMSFITFWLMSATPGNFFDTLKLNPQISPETIARYETMYHLKEPVILQYAHWLCNFIHGEFGYSFYFNVPVSHLIGSRLLNTFILSLASILLTWVLAIVLGVLAALKHNSILDRVLGMCSMVAFSTPGFFLAILLLYLISQWGILPLGGLRSPDWDMMNGGQKVIDVLRHLIIPTTVLSLGSIGALQRIMRGNMLSVLRQPYILAARARGIPEYKIIFKHALRNAFNPLVTLLGYEFASLLSGAALIEIVVSWPGLGSLLLTAVRSKDVYVVMASMMMAGSMLLIGNWLADILLKKLDPRIEP